MHTSKAVQIISVLNEAELKDAEKFINSPYFNSNRNIIRLFGLLKKHYPDFGEELIQKGELFSKLFPGKTYNEQVMKNLSSGLLQLLLEFLAIDKYRGRNTNDKELDILRELNSRRLDNIFLSRLKKLEKDLQDTTHMIHPLFFHLHKLETIKTQYLLSRDRQKHAAGNVMKAGDYLVYFFITELTRIAIDLNANMTSFNINYETDLVGKILERLDFEQLLEYLKKNNYPYCEMIEVYYHRLNAMLVSSEDNYHRFRESILENAGRFSLYELASLIDSLHNMAIQRVNDGAENAVWDEFEAVKMKLKYGTMALRTGGVISLLNFRNVIFSTVRLNQLSWAEEFIENYIHLVNEESRESISNHARGIIAYVKKDYDTAVKLLSNVNLENPFFASDVKTHLAIIFFEQGHYDSCTSVLDSFRHMLTSREEFSAIFREVNIRFINTVSSYIRALTSGNKGREILLKTKEKLLSYPMINHKGWLTQKADQLLENSA